MPQCGTSCGPIADDGHWQVGIVVDIDVNFPGSNKRIGVFWMGSDRVDFEPPSWLEVVKV
tara:strand:+ start:423 stop:602 length:180 start_codon:yes stop_codon:yes gene_type:complete